MTVYVFEDVAKLYEKFGIPFQSHTPGLLTPQMMQERMDFILEELNETAIAFNANDVAETIDGCIDIMVVAAGILHMMGVDSQLHWDEVHRANMLKEVGAKEGRNMQLDLFKPTNWVGPQHEALLQDCYENRNIR